MTATTVSANIPSTVAELEEALSDPARVGAAIQAGTFKDWITNYARNTLDKDATLTTQVREETQRVLGEYLREQGVADVKRPNLTPATAPAASTSATYNPKAMGAALDSDYAGSADYFKSIWHLADRGNAQIADKLRAMRNAFSSTVPSEGGFLIPETLRSELLRISLETSIVRPRARVIPMESLRVPFPAIDSTSNVSSVYGGIVGYWTEESGTLTASCELRPDHPGREEADRLHRGPQRTDLGLGALSFQAFIDQIFPEALGFYEDDAFINGNGVGQPAGFLNCLASVSVSAESGQATATIVWENLVKMYARMLPSSLNRCVWIAAPDTFPELATMALSVGTGGSAIWLNNGASGPPMTILGRPVIFSEKMPTLGTTGDISLVDLSYYLIGDRQVMSAMSSPHFKFSNDQTAYRVIERVDGQPWLKSAITPRNNSSSTLSPFVQIATR
jgi:predicted phage gp36 major capsid-like protein